MFPRSGSDDYAAWRTSGDSPDAYVCQVTQITLDAWTTVTYILMVEFMVKRRNPRPMLSALAHPSASYGIPFLRSIGKRSAQFVGIDVGIDRVRVSTLGARTQQSASDDRSGYGWLWRSEFELPVDPYQPPPTDWVHRVTETLAERLPPCVDGDQAFAVIALPIPWIHYQTTAGLDREAIQAQCDGMFANSIFESEAHLSSWPVQTDGGETVCAATSKRAACRVAETVAEVGFQVRGILPHGVAILQAAKSLTSLNPSSVVLLEPSGGLVALNNEHGCGLCRNLPPLPSATCDPLSTVEIEPWLGEIASEVLASLRFSTRSGSQSDPQAPVLISGQAAHLPGVDTALACLLDRPVAKWQYAGRTRPTSSSAGVESTDTQMAMSLSLASCAMQGSGHGGRLR